MNLASFGNIFTGGDILIIFLIVLLLFGAKKLPELARGMGQAVREFSKAKDDFEREVSKPTDLVVTPAQDRLEHQPVEPVVAAAPLPDTTHTRS